MVNTTVPKDLSHPRHAQFYKPGEEPKTNGEPEPTFFSKAEVLHALSLLGTSRAALIIKRLAVTNTSIWADPKAVNL